MGAGTEAASRAGAAAAICVGAAVVGTLAWVAGAGWFALKRAATRGKNAAAANATAQRKKRISARRTGIAGENDCI